jgi:hypothetical protein
VRTQLYQISALLVSLDFIGDFSFPLHQGSAEISRNPLKYLKQYQMTVSDFRNMPPAGARRIAAT